MLNLKLEAPWYTFQKKLAALFERDVDIKVGDIYECDAEDVQYCLDIEVRKHEKFVALDRVLPDVKEFGNVKLAITLYDEENNADNPDIALYKTIFEGNPILQDIKEIIDPAGVSHVYVQFKPEVIQFFDDDISDYNGNWSGLAQSIAQEVFDNDYRGVYFCTAAINEG